jgi:hypothetical protein
MEVETRLYHLERKYRRALSGAVAAKARYLALTDDHSANAVARNHARRAWLLLDTIKQAIAQRIWALQSANSHRAAARPRIPAAPLRWLPSPDSDRGSSGGQEAFRFG